MKSHEGSCEGSGGRSLFYRFEWAMERLAEAGLAVYAPDHRGLITSGAAVEVPELIPPGLRRRLA